MSEKTTEMFRRLMQVKYIPHHANGDENHPDCENGFVTSVNHQFVFVRYLYPDGTLRTVANSEATDPNDLIEFWHNPKSKIDEMFIEQVNL